MKLVGRRWLGGYNRAKLLTNLDGVAYFCFPFTHYTGKRRLNGINGFIGLHFAELIIERDGVAGIFQKRNHFCIANTFTHNRNGDGLNVRFARLAFFRQWVADFRQLLGLFRG